MTLPRLHPRVVIVRRAENEIREAVADIAEKHALTDGESIAVVTGVMSSWLNTYAKYLVRMERHDDPNKAGGWE